MHACDWSLMRIILIFNRSRFDSCFLSKNQSLIFVNRFKSSNENFLRTICCRVDCFTFGNIRYGNIAFYLQQIWENMRYDYIACYLQEIVPIIYHTMGSQTFLHVDPNSSEKYSVDAQIQYTLSINVMSN